MPENHVEMQKKQAIMDFEAMQAKRYQTGKRWIAIIAAMNIIGAILTAIFDFNLFVLALQLALSISLYVGVVWVRYLFVAFAATNAMINLIRLYYVSIGPDTPFISHFIPIVTILYCFTICYLLTCNHDVNEFLYSQKYKST